MPVAGAWMDLLAPNHCTARHCTVLHCITQVEVACVERGHALAYAWNCSISAAEAVMVELRCQNQQLLNVNGQLAATQEELVKELKAVDFLR